MFWWTTTSLKPHVFWWTQNLMWFDGPLMIFRVHQITWGFWVHQNTGVHKKLMWFDGPIFSTSLGPLNHMRFLQLLWLTSKNELTLFWLKQCFWNSQKILETFAHGGREINGWKIFSLTRCKSQCCKKFHEVAFARLKKWKVKNYQQLLIGPNLT